MSDLSTATTMINQQEQSWWNSWGKCAAGSALTGVGVGLVSKILGLFGFVMVLFGLMVSERHVLREFLQNDRNKTHDK